MRFNRERGFTLIELLVVIAIIAILAAILFPVFAKAREKARQTNCLNNQKQITSAILMFVQDHDETFPEKSTWVTEIAGAYGTTGKVWDCPTSSFRGSEASPDYGYNSFLSNVALGDISDPTEVPTQADLAQSTKTAKMTLVDFDKDLDPRHNDGIVVGFADGHVTFVNLKPFGGQNFGGMLANGIDPFGGVKPVLNQSATLNLNQITSAWAKHATTYDLPEGAYATATNTTQPNFSIEAELKLGVASGQLVTLLGAFMPDGAAIVTNDGWYFGPVGYRCWHYGAGSDCTVTNLGGLESTSIVDLYFPSQSTRDSIGDTPKPSTGTWSTCKSIGLRQKDGSYKVTTSFSGSTGAKVRTRTLSAAAVAAWQGQKQIGLLVWSNTTFIGSAQNIKFRVLPDIF